MLYAEHSPIRSCTYRITFEDIKSWVATHLVRHHIGIEPFVSTQRSDRTNTIDEGQRDLLSQGALIKMHLVLNAQAWINISRKRLCSCASKETKIAWLLALTELDKIDPELRAVCVKECLYRGFCPERKTCGFTNSSAFINLLYKYRYGGQNGGKETAGQSGMESEVCSVQLRESLRKEQSPQTGNSRKARIKTNNSYRRKIRTSRKGTRKNEAQPLPA